MTWEWIFTPILSLFCRENTHLVHPYPSKITPTHILLSFIVILLYQTVLCCHGENRKRERANWKPPFIRAKKKDAFNVSRSKVIPFGSIGIFVWYEWIGSLILKGSRDMWERILSQSQVAIDAEDVLFRRKCFLFVFKWFFERLDCLKANCHQLQSCNHSNPMATLLRHMCTFTTK